MNEEDKQTDRTMTQRMMVSTECVFPRRVQTKERVRRETLLYNGDVLTIQTQRNYKKWGTELYTLNGSNGKVCILP